LQRRLADGDGSGRAARQLAPTWCMGATLDTARSEPSASAAARVARLSENPMRTHERGVIGVLTKTIFAGSCFSDGSRK